MTTSLKPSEGVVISSLREGMRAEREAVLRERRAFICGLESACWRDPATEKSALGAADKEAARLYPLPQIERPREVADPHEKAAVLWRIGKDSKGDPALEYRFNRGPLDRSEPWRTFPNYTNAPWCLYTTGPRVALWADLFANPTELVEDDGSEQMGGPR